MFGWFSQRKTETEIVIDPIILALAWEEIAPSELRRERQEYENSDPSDMEDDNFSDDTGRIIFGNKTEYPLSFFKETLLFSTNIRLPFSGRKFSVFKEILHDQVKNKFHKHLKNIRPVFNDGHHVQFRNLTDTTVSRPWDEFFYGLHQYNMPKSRRGYALPNDPDLTEAWIRRRIFRFLNEDLSIDMALEDVTNTCWPNGEPVDLSQGFPQFLTDYFVRYRYSFGLPYFSFNDASQWGLVGNFGQGRDDTPRSNSSPEDVQHSIRVSMPDLAEFSFDDIFEMRDHSAFNFYRTAILEGELKNLSKTDVNEKLQKEMEESFEEAKYGYKEHFFNLGRILISPIPIFGVLSSYDPEMLKESKSRRFKNQWLWFVWDAKKRADHAE